MTNNKCSAKDPATCRYHGIADKGTRNALMKHADRNSISRELVLDLVDGDSSKEVVEQDTEQLLKTYFYKKHKTVNLQDVELPDFKNLTQQLLTTSSKGKAPNIFDVTDEVRNTLQTLDNFNVDSEDRNQIALPKTLDKSSYLVGPSRRAALDEEELQSDISGDRIRSSVNKDAFISNESKFMFTAETLDDGGVAFADYEWGTIGQDFAADPEDAKAFGGWIESDSTNTFPVYSGRGYNNRMSLDANKLADGGLIIEIKDGSTPYNEVVLGPEETKSLLKWLNQL